MGTTLTPGNVPPERAPAQPKGHDTRTLGPGDSSDSGSDMAGAHLEDDETESEIAGELGITNEERREPGSSRNLRPPSPRKTGKP